MAGTESVGELSWVRAPSLAGVDLIRVRAEPALPTAIVGQLLILRCDDGAGEARWGGRLELLRPGATLVQPPEAPPALVRRCAGELRCRLALIDPACLPAMTTWGTTVVSAASALVESLDALFVAVEDGADAAVQRAALRALLEATLTHAAAGSPPAPLTPGVARARSELQARWSESVPLCELAAVAGLSKCHLVHLFHKEVGLPPHAYQIQLRLVRARTLAAAGMPLAEVAMRTGFADQSHLTRHFKRCTGLPPGRYAALHLPRPLPTVVAP